MPMFVTIGYGDEAGYAGITAAVRDAAHQRDAQLRAGGALVGIAGKAVQVRNPDAAGMRVDEGAFMRSDLPVAGFGVIQADAPSVVWIEALKAVSTPVPQILIW